MVGIMWVFMLLVVAVEGTFTRRFEGVNVVIEPLQFLYFYQRNDLVLWDLYVDGGWRMKDGGWRMDDG